MSNYTVEVKQEDTKVSIAETGPAGPRGEGLITFFDEADSVMVTGDVVYKASGKVAKVIADGSVVPRVAGMVMKDVAQGSAAEYKMEGSITLTDWTPITGTTTLSEGSFYYLSPTTAGDLTTSAPITVGQYVVQVGYAQSTTQLNLQIQPPIKL